jgi:uncharacterized protein YggE
MRFRLVVVIGVVALGLVVTACGETPRVDVQAPLDRGPDTLPDGVTVSGEGEVEGAPDTLSVDLGVSLKRPSVGEAVAASAEVANAIIGAVQAAGVEEKDVQTRSYTVNQEFRYPQNGTPIPDGYRVTNTVTVRVRDLTNAGPVIDAATAAGGNDTQINGVAFSLENDGPALSAARDKAFRDARAKAEQYADLAGVSLGGAQAISDVVVSPIAEQFTDEAARAVAFDASSTPNQPGQVTTSVTVNARFPLG